MDRLQGRDEDKCPRVQGQRRFSSAEIFGFQSKKGFVLDTFCKIQPRYLREFFLAIVVIFKVCK